MFDKLNVKVPQVTRVTHNFKDKIELSKNLPITEKEAVPLFKKSFQRNSLQLNKKKIEERKYSRTDEVILEVRKLHFKYTEDVHALRGIDFKVHKGEFIGIIGQNGAGNRIKVFQNR